MAQFDLALTAQSSKKWDLATLIEKFHGGVRQLSIVATFDTGVFLKSLTGIDSGLVPPGPEGGYERIAGLVRIEKVRMVIFLHDPRLSLDNPGVMALLQACNDRNIPFANNLTTADFILQRFLEIEQATFLRCPEARLVHQYT